VEVEGVGGTGRRVGVLAGRRRQAGCHAGALRAAYLFNRPGAWARSLIVVNDGKTRTSTSTITSTIGEDPSHPPPPPVAFLPFRQMDSQQCDVRWGDPADPARLPKGGRSDLGEFLPGFKTQASDIFIIEPVGNILGF
jgi:hypothetical protein